MRLVCTTLLLLLGVSPLHAQKTPPGKTPTPEILKAIKDKTDKLAKQVNILTNQKVRDPGLAEVEIYLEAARKIVEHNEFFQADAGKWTLDVLDRGLLRASFLAMGEMPWALTTGYPVLRAYRSRLDGSVQPYAVTYPAAYGKEPGKKWRLDVVLHGRNANLTEVNFLKSFMGDKPADLHYVKIDIFGRGNNAYRWAGEADVLETLDNFLAGEQLLRRGGLLDPGRVVLRGFSMGGAGTWHLGLHLCDRWCVIGPGAGFTTTHGYIAKLKDPLPYPQEECLRIYDAVLYAPNAFNVPIVAYSGGNDPQKKAADNIESRLKEIGLKMTHLVAPGLEHQFPAEWQKKAETLFAQYANKGRPEYAPEVRFVTYTLKYPSCNWVEILGLDRHYQKSMVEAAHTDQGFVVRTSNVRILHLTLPQEGVAGPQVVAIDNQKLTVRPWVNQAGTYHLYLQMRDGQWASVLPQRLVALRAQHPQKISGLTGPIDDAFTDAFLCVRGTDKPWHDATGKYAEGNLERFKHEWAKYFRGTLPVKDDIDVTSEDIAGKHLILFGDPASNALIAQVLDGLPLKWTKDTLEFAGAKGAAAENVPVLIYPNPLNPGRYVVLNSGHTFHAADFQGTNALLYPRLGDYAVLKLQATQADPLGAQVVTSGLFDDFWRIGAKSRE